METGLVMVLLDAMLPDTRSRPSKLAFSPEQLEVVQANAFPIGKGCWIRRCSYSRKNDDIARM
ncbi:MAG: hypothetical protein IPN38_15205 [Flavobacteriales bacterium]|nr:hypothetical protein [Flavobacteriales bacterium]